jgi:DNA repair ATPase RecN
MTDWNKIIENIQNAIQAVDDTQRVSEKLRTEPTVEHVDEFQQQAEELCKRLAAMGGMLEKGSEFPLEELTERLSQIFSGDPKTYRKTPQYSPKEIVKDSA